jgi:5'(3')-deoxyribonucleotidase
MLYTSTMNIFLDMDDVVADWMRTAREMVQRNWNYGERIPDSDWKKLQRDPHFYRNLPKKDGADELVQWCRDYKEKTGCGLYFLTALPHDYTMPHAASDKVWWAHERYPDIPVFFGPFSHDKWRHCKPGDILIDDRTSNCSEWTSAGGLAHIYKQWPECKLWLEETLK